MSSPTAPSIDWSSIKALTFDIYGTLIDWDAGLLRATHATALQPYIPSDAHCLQAIADHSARLESEHPRMSKSDIHAESLRLYAEDLGLREGGKLASSLTREEIEGAAREFGASIGGYEAFKDTVEAIRRLSKHFILVPLTNMDQTSYDATLSGPLAGCPFTASYIAEDIGSYKPDLANFHYLLEHLQADHGIVKDEVCHVAQSLFHDHEPAKKMGLRSVWVDRYGVLEEMGREWNDVREEFGMVGRVSGLSALADLVEGILGKA